MKKRNFLSPGDIRRYFLTLSPELVGRLTEAPVKYFRPDRPPQLKNFYLSGVGKMPLVVKIRGAERPEAGMVYRVIIQHEDNAIYTDQNGVKRKTIRRIVVRLYADHNNESAQAVGELRFSDCEANEQMFWSPEPILLQQVLGLEKKGYLWIAEPDTEYRIRYRDQQDEILFEGGVVVMIANFEREVAGAQAVDLELDEGAKLTVYDRRKNRFSPYAFARHIRRKLGRGKWSREFEFITLRDLKADELANGLPAYVLRETGLEPVEGLG
jgi:hypothetical protein